MHCNRLDNDDSILAVVNMPSELRGCHLLGLRGCHEMSTIAHGTCWPTQATIWAMLTGLPLLPHWLMMSGLLCDARVRMHSSPALLRMPLSRPWICASRLASIVMPACRVSLPVLNAAISRSASACLHDK